MFNTSAKNADASRDRERPCDIAPVSGVWVSAEIPFIRAYAEEFIRRTSLNVADVLLCRNDERGAIAVWSFLVKRKEGRVFIVGVSSDFAVRQSKHLRAWMAHEVAHWVPQNANDCETARYTNKKEAEALCEQAVDRIAAGWAGRTDMVLALRGLGEHLEAERRATQHVSPDLFATLRRRILYLEQATR